MVRKHADPYMKRYFKCEICKRGFQLKDFDEHFKAFHFKLINDGNVCKAKTCMKKFKLLPELLVHIRLHHIRYYFWCSLCCFFFHSVNDWEQHKS